MDLESLVHPNQSIRIVPSLEDYLNDNGFCTELDSSTTAKFDNLKTTWHTLKRSLPTRNVIHDLFHSMPDPFKGSLVLIVKCEDNIKDYKPKSLPYYIIEEIYAWKVKYSRIANCEIKLVAFHIATQQRNQDFLDLIVRAYDIKDEKMTVIPQVKDLIKQGYYKLAIQSVISLEIYDHLPVEDLLFPLILQDKANMVETYLAKCPHQAKPFIIHIDKLLDRSCSIRDTIQKYVEEHNVIDLKWEKLYHKPLGKLVARLCTKFNVPLQDCKNLSKNRTTGGLRYLIGQKYQEKNLSDSAWNDIVKDSLNQNPEAVYDFIDMLITYDIAEAKKWADYFKLPDDVYPSVLKSLPCEKLTNSKQPEEENWELQPSTSQDYYNLSLSMDKICIIDDVNDFMRLIENDFNHLNFVGIDCEWKPSFGATQSKVALIQIATTDNVYLIDCIMMNGIEFTHVWQLFLNKVVDNAELIKIGFGLDHDVREMKNTFSRLFNLKMKGEGFLDLGKLWKYLENSGVQFPHEDDVGGESLSCLTKACFGLPLMKHEQCSNWETRPLRQSQIKYAALDSYVLVEIYLFLQYLCNQQNLSFYEICCDVMLEVKKSAKKSKAQSKIEQPINNAYLNITVDKLKILADSHLYPVVPYLRFCDIDCALIPKDMLWHNVINLAISEDRYILLSKIKHTPTANYPQNKIVTVLKADAKQQLLEILQTFQVSLAPENLFKRCVLCNSSSLTVMSNDKVRDFYTGYKRFDNTHLSKFNYESDVDQHEFDGFLSGEDSDEELYQAVPTSDRQELSAKEDNKVCLTDNGVAMNLEEISELPLDYSDPIFVCQDCGKFYWNGHHPIKNVSSLINELPLT